MTQTNESYNGWANKETWAASLWLNNDEGLYNSARDALRGSDRQAETLRGWMEELRDDCPDLPMWSEIGSIWRVDWESVAAGLMGE